MIVRFIRILKHYCGNAIRFWKHYYLRLAGVKIGAGTMISIGAKIDVRRGSIIIGKNCIITHGTVILSHDTAAQRLRGAAYNKHSTILGDGVFVGVNSVILPGVVIGDNAVIGAGSVVTVDVPANSVAYGNPARVVKQN